MPPLAYLIAKWRMERNDINIDKLKLFDGSVQFFEVSLVHSEITYLAKDLAKRSAPTAERLAFLPARRVWLETSVPFCFDTLPSHRAARVDKNALDAPHKRVAFLLEQKADDAIASLKMISLVEDGHLYFSDPIAGLPLFGSGVFGGFFNTNNDSDIINTKIHVLFSYGALAIINSPKIFQQEKHEVHRGFAKTVRQQKTPWFSMSDWTEIKLHVSAPSDVSTKTTETRFSGARAQHFVRSHLRIRLGKLELVSPHWRGDPALGIRQNRYAAQPVLKPGEKLLYADQVPTR